MEQIEKIRHSLAHVLASAIMGFWPKTKLAIGPAIENGFYYDMELPKEITPQDLEKIETRMKELIKEGQKFVGKKITKQAAKKIFKGQSYKLEIIKELPGKTVGTYQNGNFLDLCKGGHVENTKEINPNAFKLTNIAGAYWRGDEKKKMLTRIYGVAFETEQELMNYLKIQEEAEKRDHRILGERLKLFTFSKEVGPGLPLWLPHGTIIRDSIEMYAKQIEKEWGYKRVSTPHIAKEDLYKMSGHIPYYADSMYPPMKLDDGNYYLKAMNCPHTHMIYKSEPRSYRDLPLRYAEYGTVYRYELSGTLAGLLRVRGFTQNDAHIYCTEEQAEEEFLKVMKLHEFWYKEVFGIRNFYMRLSLPAKDQKKYVDIPKGWQKSVEIIKNAMKKSGLAFEEMEGEAAFYGPKVDFQIKSVVGREETASTNQLDFLATQRFDLTYIDKDGKQKPIYVIHRAPLGSHERFIAFLIEHYAGAFPVWLAPVQVAVIPISTEKHLDYAKKVAQVLLQQNLRVEVMTSNDTLGKKIREAEIQRIPYLLIMGDKEMQANTVSIRQRIKGDSGTMTLDAFAEKIKEEVNNKSA